MQDTSNIMHIYIKKGWLNVNIDRMDEAMENCLKGLKLAEEQHAHAYMADFYTTIGVILEKQDDLDQALEYAQKAIPAYEEAGDYLAAGSAKISVAIIYKNQQKYEVARAIYTDMLPFYEKEDFPMGTMSVLANKTVPTRCFDSKSNTKVRNRQKRIFLCSGLEATSFQLE